MEIAALLNVKEGTVKYYLAESKQQLNYSFGKKTLF
jgi:DNA-directed RNA polymerase specialized sigma24 family protein